MCVCVSVSVSVSVCVWSGVEWTMLFSDLKHQITF